MLLECFFATKTLMRERITENTRVQFPVGTKKFGEGILSTSQAGLRRAAPSSYTALWQKAGDQPSYREPGPFGGCNFLSHKCFCSKETLEEHLAQDAPRVFLCYKNTYARENYSPRRGPVPGRKAGRPPFARVLYSCLVRRDVIPLAT